MIYGDFPSVDRIDMKTCSALTCVFLFFFAKIILPAERICAICWMITVQITVVFIT